MPARRPTELRTEAYQVLDDARAEVATLTTRRDEIAEELGRLSGVIEALSVTPHRPRRRNPQTCQDDRHPRSAMTGTDP